jgi:hypothetical protein
MACSLPDSRSGGQGFLYYREDPCIRKKGLEPQGAVQGGKGGCEQDSKSPTRLESLDPHEKSGGESWRRDHQSRRFLSEQGQGEQGV